MQTFDGARRHRLGASFAEPPLFDPFDPVPSSLALRATCPSRTAHGSFIMTSRASLSSCSTRNRFRNRVQYTCTTPTARRHAKRMATKLAKNSMETALPELGFAPSLTPPRAIFGGGSPRGNDHEYARAKT